MQLRLSAWRASAPRREAASGKVAAIVDDVLAALGAGDDPHCWVVWGEEPATRYSILVPTDPGLIHCYVRVNVSGEGPRTTTKLVRWSRVAIGELAVETQAGHRLLSFQVEQQVLRGVDTEADRVAAFALRVIAAIDGRPLPPVAEERSPGRSRAASSRTAAGRAAAPAARNAAKPTAASERRSRPPSTPADPAPAGATARGRRPGGANASNATRATATRATATPATATPATATPSRRRSSGR